MSKTGFLGIDIGTQGLSVVLTDQNLNVQGTGEAGYDMLPGLPEGCYEQLPQDWMAALVNAMEDLRRQVSDWDLPAWFKFLLVTGIPTLLLLGIYEVAVRYTFIGWILNGRKRRNSSRSTADA